MVYYYDLVILGDSFYFAKWEHKGHILTCTVNASCISDARRKIIVNFKQKIYTSNGKIPPFVERSDWQPKVFNTQEIHDVDYNRVILKKDKDLANDQPKIWEVKKIELPDGTTSWQAIKHEVPLMTEFEAKKFILEQQFS